MSRVRLDEMRGEAVYDNDGDKIGKVEEIYYDAQSNRSEWIGIGTGFLRTKRVLVPVQGAELWEDGLRVPYSKDQVKDSPDIDEDEISAQGEAELVAFYGVSGYESEASTRDRTGTAEESVTRSEEEIEVGTRPVEAGRARLRKWVETEPVALDVELRHEVARVTREQLDQPVTDHEFTEEQVEVPLRGEKPVVQKQAVAKERVALEKDVRTERETVTDELKKERVEVEGDVDQRQ
jgi:uncharacterized protein (TIGR02271 family)